MSEVKEIKKRIDFLDYLKAICVIMVIITHYDWADKDSPFLQCWSIWQFLFLWLLAVIILLCQIGKDRWKFEENVCMGDDKTQIDPFSCAIFTVCLIEIVLLVIEDKHINPPRIFLLGAYGPGSYYVPIMIQLLVIFPIIYKLVEKMPDWESHCQAQQIYCSRSV